MLIVFTPEATQKKNDYLNEFADIERYFERLENAITQNPYSTVRRDRYLIKNRFERLYAKSTITGVFSGNLLDTRMRLTFLYNIKEKEQQIEIVGVYLER